MKETVKIAREALCIADMEGFALAAKAEEGAPRKLNMVAYSGGIIKNHWRWGNLAIDKMGIGIPKSLIPVLHEHDTDQKIAIGKFALNEKGAIVCTDSKYLDTEDARKFLSLSDEGFPFQASIFARPTKIQRVMEEEEVEVNGFMLKGPGTVWRECQLKECSVVTFGADSNTKSVAMSENETIEVEVETKLKEVSMDLTKLKAEHPDLYNQIVAEGKAQAEQAFAAEKVILDKQIEELTAANGQLSAANKDVATRLLSLEKEAEIRRETGIKMMADTMFAEKIKTTNIPARLHPKVRRQLSHDTFIKNGSLDATAFAAAIDAELKDWASVGEESAILGMSMSSGNDNSFSEDALVTRMLGHVGHTKQ